MPIVAIIWLVTLGTAVGVALFDALIISGACEGEGASEIARKICIAVIAQWFAMGVMACLLCAFLASPAS